VNGDRRGAADPLPGVHVVSRLRVDPEVPQVRVGAARRELGLDLAHRPGRVVLPRDEQEPGQVGVAGRRLLDQPQHREGEPRPAPVARLRVPDDDHPVVPRQVERRPARVVVHQRDAALALEDPLDQPPDQGRVAVRQDPDDDRAGGGHRAPRNQGLRASALKTAIEPGEVRSDMSYGSSASVRSASK
jgi:hypothetical protein